MTEKEIATVVVDCAFRVHSTSGPGLLETVYETAFAYELQNGRLLIQRQVQSVPIRYGTIFFEGGFVADLIVENRLIIELKSIGQVAPVHKKQLITYLRLADKRLGVLINVGEALIKNGITRLVKKLPEESRAPLKEFSI